MRLIGAMRTRVLALSIVFSQPFGGIRAFHDLHDPTANAGQRIPQFRSCIATVGKHMAQLWGLPGQLTEHFGRTVTGLSISRMNAQRDQMAAGVGHNMAFAGFDLLACVIAGIPTVLSGFHALAVDCPGGGLDRAQNAASITLARPTKRVRAAQEWCNNCPFLNPTSL